MVEVPDLSKLGKTPAQPDLNSLSPEERAKLDALASETPTEVVTAFVVYQTPNGEWAATSDLDQLFSIQRSPTPDDLTAGSAVVMRDIQIQATAAETAQLTTRAVIQNMLALSQQAAEQQQVQAVKQTLAKARR